ncbi:MAG: hypothetical protein HMLKMBBP_03351 [Planctomycetes bacterium]|nr:hypothetical protein [Planctomycetota bacterium]
MSMRPLPWDYGVRNLGRSKLRLALAVAGSFLVVLLVLAAAAFVRGMGRSLVGAAVPENVMLLGAGSEESIERSEIQAATTGIAAASIPGIRSRLGVPYVSPEIHMATLAEPVGGASDGVQHFVNLRAVETPAFLVHPQVRIVEGRAPGPDELIVGRLAAARSGLPDEAFSVGRKLRMERREWTIVGRFEAPGTVMDAEVWLPLQDLRVAAKRETISCVVMTMEDSDTSQVELFAKLRTDLELAWMRESDYYAALMSFYGPVRAMVWVTAVLVAAGAFLGGLNTMYAAFASRIREIATLQALGYTRAAVLLSLVQESVLTAAAGSLAGAGVAALLFDGFTVRISMGAFGLVVDGPVMALGLGAGLVLGVVGALPPAWRCLGMSVASALKAA